MSRTTSPQTIRNLAAVAMRGFSLLNCPPALPVQAPAPVAPVVQMSDLTHVARHILRFMYKVPLVSSQTLRRETGRDSDMLPAISTLVRRQLIEATHRSYRITDAGISCVNAAQPH